MLLFGGDLVKNFLDDVVKLNDQENKMKKSSTHIILITLLLIIGCSKNESSLHSVLKEVSNKMNKTTPVKVDKYTTLFSTYVMSEKSFSYFYKINEMLFKEYNISESEWRKSQVTNLTNFYCKDSDFSFYKDNNISVTWKYSYENGSPLTKIEINNNDCYN